MSYLEFFPYIALAWGTLSVAVGLKGESGNPVKYTILTKVWLIIGWGYLAACVPIFQEAQHFASSMEFFYGAFAVLLSLEVWFIFMGTLTAVALAKQAHDPDFSSLLIKWHQPMKRVLKPMLQVVSALQVANALNYLLEII